MIEWAVDQAVHGRLMVERPWNYLKAGQAAYQPQSMFHLNTLADGGTVPAQIMLGIIAQETNMSQASWHAAVGDLGNPLIANYYGSYSINTVDYSKSDCGYGIAQVTSGMRIDTLPQTYTHAQQVAIATDYAANIAAALNILIDKWNQLKQDPAGPSWVNDGSSQYVENWFLAIWAYNSGYYPSTDIGLSPNDGHYGVGWLNNPANPQYDASRDPFLRNEHYQDALIPSHWSYPERIMGWIETPQLKGVPANGAYSTPSYGSQSNGKVTNPKDYYDNYIFCDSVNACSSQQPLDPCPSVNSSCWWHGTAEFAACPARCATEKLAYSLGSSEPEVVSFWESACVSLSGGRDSYRDTSLPILTVYDLNDTGQYALGCDVSVSNGKFTIRMGSPSGGYGALYAPYDLHQLGAGYKGHMWFTHVYPDDWTFGDFEDFYEPRHQIIGTWTPDLAGQTAQTQRYDILVSLPSHGASYKSAEYVIWQNWLDIASDSCVINQGSSAGTDTWRYLGSYDLAPGARVQLSNIGASSEDGTVDIAYDAVAFIPITGQGYSCGVQYGN
jgi:hypothetical protein